MLRCLTDVSVTVSKSTKMLRGTFQLITGCKICVQASTALYWRVRYFDVCKTKLKCSRISPISCGSSSNSSERQREIKGQRERKKREKHILLEV